MEIVPLQDIEAAAARAAEVMRSGGVILYPTDTVYGLGGDALSTEVVERIAGIKGRDTSAKHMLAIASDLDMVRESADVDEVVEKLAQIFWPGPLTLVMKKLSGETGIWRGINTIAIRVPDNAFCRALARAAGTLTISTSANKSGEPVLQSVGDILMQLGNDAEAIDLVIDAGLLTNDKPSTIVDISADEVRILREGAIPKEAIFAVL